MTSSLKKPGSHSRDIRMRGTMEGVPRIGNGMIREIGILESNNLLEDYVSRVVFGVCRILHDKTQKVFTLPEQRDEMHSYLREIDLREGVMVDLSPVAICLLVDGNYMYTFQAAY